MKWIMQKYRGTPAADGFSPPKGDLQVFGYGSLIAYAGKLAPDRTARLIAVARGTHAAPMPGICTIA